MYRRIVTTRLLADIAAPLKAVPPGLVLAACLLASGCSPGADYPPLFPALHDTQQSPPATLDAAQVQQATKDLIADRDRLTAEAQASGQNGAAAPDAGQAAKTSAPKNQAAKVAKTQAANGQAGNATVTQAAGAETK